MPILKKNFYCLSITLLLLSCTGVNEKFPPIEGDVLPMQYSSLLSIVECDGYTVVDIADPWGESTMVRYLLVPSDSALPPEMPSTALQPLPLRKLPKRTWLLPGGKYSNNRLKQNNK